MNKAAIAIRTFGLCVCARLLSFYTFLSHSHSNSSPFYISLEMKKKLIIFPGLSNVDCKTNCKVHVEHMCIHAHLQTFQHSQGIFQSRIKCVCVRAIYTVVKFLSCSLIFLTLFVFRFQLYAFTNKTKEKQQQILGKMK